MQNNIPIPLGDTAQEWQKYITLLWQDQAEMDRKRKSKEVIDYYKNKQRGYLEQELKNIYSDTNSLRFKRKITCNLTKQLVDALAQVYATSVKRTSGKKRLDALFREKLWANEDRIMSLSERMAQLERTTVVMSRWSDTKQHVVYSNYKQYEFSLVYDAIDEKQLLAVILSDYHAFDKAKIIVYTHNNTYHFLGGKLTNQINHNLNILPFVVINIEDPGFEDYLEPDTELVNANLEMNVMISNLLNVVQTQAHGILVIKLGAENPELGSSDANPNISGGNELIEKDRRLDTHDVNKSVIKMYYDAEGREPKAEALQFEADIEGIIKAIECVADYIGNGYNVEIDLSVNTAGGEATATYVRITEDKRKAILKEREYIFRDAEKELFNIASQQLKLAEPNTPETNPEDFTVEYIDQTSALEHAKIDDLLKLRNQPISDVEIAKALYPSIDDAEAMEKVKRWIEQQNELNGLKQENTNENQELNQEGIITPINERNKE